MVVVVIISDIEMVIVKSAVPVDGCANRSGCNSESYSSIGSSNSRSSSRSSFVHNSNSDD